MTAQDRGAYTPQTDAPLAFDARAPRGSRKPLPMALIGGVVVLIALVAAVAIYYRNGVRGGSSASPPVAGDPIAHPKAPPSAATVAKDRDDDPFSSLDAGVAQNVPTKAPTFAPAAEQPQPRPAPGLTVQTVDPSPVHAVPATPAAAPQPAPAVKPAPTTAVAAAPLPPTAAAPAPVATPAKSVPTASTAAAAPARAAATTPSPDASAPPTPASNSPASVQIGAYSSSALADKGYQDVAGAFPTFMGGKAKHVEPLERDGKTLYRTSVAGFASKSSAQAFCAALKASGRVCLVKG